MGKVLIYLWCVLVAGMFLSGCNSSCTDNKSSIPLAGFYSYETLQAITVNDISIGGVGAPNDSLLLEKGSANKIYLPFRSGNTETSYMIRYESEELGGGELYDVIQFTYESIPYFASEECRAMYKYIISDVTHTNVLIDSVGLVTDEITNADIETIRIYFRTRQPEDSEE